MQKTAIITGGSRGIGYAIAQRLATDGFAVVLAATRPAEECGERLHWFEERGFPCLYVQADVSLAAGRARIVEAAVERFGGVTALVNNAGVAPRDRRDLLDMEEESFDRLIGINTKSALFLTQLVARRMLAQSLAGRKRGTIVNVSSCSAEVVSLNRGEYCVSKAGVSMLTQLFAARLAGEGIFVHEVRPGVIDTDMTAGVREKYDRLIAQGAFPIPRWGRAEDVAAAVAVFCGEDFLYTTGNYVDVDGGFHIRQL